MLKKILLPLAICYSSSILAGADFPIINNQGKTIGNVAIKQGTEGVLINIKAKGLPPGYHGMHFHRKGDCSDLATFKSAEGHIDPHKKPHGYLNPKGPHEGNLPNLIVSQDGSVEVELYSHMVQLKEGPAKLLDEDGSALIIHANKDDHTSQPIGGSGGRLACAIIK
ncbi:superoxide dismutase family protein [Endozoicomonas sp. SM1973]|uniref:Superoxide dismutase [Cu-Zn] n=1 Tax=Spartinivicinus marinus TaxID=2994442 RepID=A0A853I3E3_9GAMM|nr:superoxide dismutase family protein [Spartinivicinus marinus]MCX4026637.1 superoxide dismutase family protein [Spartinivicinus marinus]NYZ64471.1 superoxide dismutase family protein [Spartinivicinus marinus]